MKRKPVKKHHHLSHRAKKRNSLAYIRYTIVTFGVLALIFGINIIKTINKPHVLGESANSILLADHGSDDSGSSSGGGGDHGGSSSGGGSSGGNSPSGGGSSGGDHAPSNNSAPNNPAPIVQPTIIEKKEVPEVKKTEVETESVSQKLTVKTENEKTEVNLSSAGTQVEIKTEGDKIVFKAKKADGTEIELEQNDALEKLNESLKESEIEVGTTAAQGFTIKKGEVEAETHFPLSVNPITHTLTVTTPSGAKEVNVLPDQAVKNLLQTHLISNVESQNILGTSTQKVTLSELNSEPVFEVKGIADKKILGFIPFAFSKTIFVSTQTGQTVRIDEAFISKLLEALSS